MNALLLMLALTVQAPARDADGWTVLTPAADSRMIYVSSSAGNDTNAGTEAAPVATIAKAYTLTRNKFPDQILLKRSDQFIANISYGKSGRAINEPMVFSAYGEGNRPIINGQGLNYWGANGGVGYSMNFVAITGIEFRGGPGLKAINFAGGMDHILIEDCAFSKYGTVALHIQNINADTPKNITIRRNAVTDCDGQGMLINYTDGLSLEENLVDHNGHSGDGPNMLRHNVYLSDIKHLTAQNNIFARGSNFGLKMATNNIAGFTDFVVENNLFLNNGISMDASSGIPLGITTYRHQRGVVKDNVFTELGRQFANGAVQDTAAWLRNTESVVWDGNHFVHKPALAGNPLISWGNNERHKDITISNSVVHNWNLGANAPATMYFEFQAYQEPPLVGVTNLQLVNNRIDKPDAEYADPSRTVGSYYASIGGINDAVAFLEVARNQSKANWNAAYTADAVNDYIRDGFLVATPEPNPELTRQQQIDAAVQILIDLNATVQEIQTAN